MSPRSVPAQAFGHCFASDIDIEVRPTVSLDCAVIPDLQICMAQLGGAPRRAQDGERTGTRLVML